MSYELPIDKSRFDYRSDELFYNSLMSSCEKSCLRDYRTVFRSMPQADKLEALCIRQLEEFTWERLPILMTLPYPEHHIIMTSKRIALRQSYHFYFENESAYLTSLKEHEVTDLSEQILDDILFEQAISRKDRLDILKRLNPRDCYLYYLRYLCCLSPAQIEAVTVWKKDAIASQVKHANKRIAREILPLFKVDLRNKKRKEDL